VIPNGITLFVFNSREASMRPDDPRIKPPSKYRGNPVTDIAGRRFGRLTVIKLVGSIKGRAAWLCQCDCGNEVTYVGTKLLEKRKPTTSCGCYQGGHKIKNYPDPLYYIVDEYKKSAKDRSKEWDISHEYAAALMRSPCHYCGTLKSRYSKKFGLEFNGIDRKDNAIGYTAGNVVPCCTECNYFKRSIGYTEFIDRVLRISRNIQRDLNPDGSL
jgi:hypothetical protein